MICWQKPRMTIDAYTRYFKANIDVCKAVGSTIGISKAAMRLACDSSLEDFAVLSNLLDTEDEVTLKRTQQLGHARYLALLYFKGLT